MRPVPVFALVVAFAAAAAFVGCDVAPPPAPPADAPTTHRHVAPHGGSLVELEHEALNAELLLDASTGRVTLWVLDGECEHPVRITQDAIELTLTVRGTAEALRLDAVADALTGETRGDTSQFAGQADTLRGAAKFSGTIRSLVVGQRAFQGVAFEYAPQR